jgi:hypothetical protein
MKQTDKQPNVNMSSSSPETKCQYVLFVQRGEINSKKAMVAYEGPGVKVCWIDTLTDSTWPDFLTGVPTLRHESSGKIVQGSDVLLFLVWFASQPAVSYPATLPPTETSNKIQALISSPIDPRQDREERQGKTPQIIVHKQVPEAVIVPQDVLIEIHSPPVEIVIDTMSEYSCEQSEFYNEQSESEVPRIWEDSKEEAKENVFIPVREPSPPPVKKIVPAPVKRGRPKRSTRDTKKDKVKDSEIKGTESKETEEAQV